MLLQNFLRILTSYNIINYNYLMRRGNNEKEDESKEDESKEDGYERDGVNDGYENPKMFPKECQGCKNKEDNKREGKVFSNKREGKVFSNKREGKVFDNKREGRVFDSKDEKYFFNNQQYRLGNNIDHVNNDYYEIFLNSNGHNILNNPEKYYFDQNREGNDRGYISYGEDCDADFSLENLIWKLFTKKPYFSENKIDQKRNNQEYNNSIEDNLNFEKSFDVPENEIKFFRDSIKKLEKINSFKNKVEEKKCLKKENVKGDNFRESFIKNNQNMKSKKKDSLIYWKFLLFEEARP
ncbi:hypothetical protein DMUE_3997 [Dictyocoela muelleri]|nr:hypothetical protein DMUE_3997 [Dictyocoela muelleri]